MRKIINIVSNLIHNSKGIMAIEFVVTIPILILLFFGMFEYNRVLYHNQKVSKISGNLADMFSMFKPVDTSKTTDLLETDCVNQPLMITDSRIRAILDTAVVDALMLPIKANKAVIHISSVYKTAGLPPRVEWRYSYQTNPALVFPSAIGAVAANANMKTIDGRVGGMFDGENYIVVETAIEYDSIISGVLDAFVPAFANGMISTTVYYPIRNYSYDVNGLPEFGLNYIWPNKLPPTMLPTTNPNDC